MYNGEEDLIDVDERLEVPSKALDAYNLTKAQAEKLVLEANGKDGLLTCALRPAGIFGCVVCWKERPLRYTDTDLLSLSPDLETALTSQASSAS